MKLDDYTGFYVGQQMTRQAFQQDLKFHPKARELGSCSINANSFLRNGTAVVASKIPNVALATAPVMAVSLVAHGILGAPLAASIVRDSYKKGKQAFSCGDAEGVANGAALGTVGSAYLGACGLLTYQGIALLQGAAIATGAGLATAGLGVAMYGALGAISLYNLKQTTDFGKEFAKKRAISDASALIWLRDQVILTEEEIKGLDEKQAAKLLQKKWNQFELRTSPEVASMVREQVPFLCSHYNGSEPQVEQIKQIVEAVEKANYKAQIKHKLLLLIVVIGLASMITAIIFTGGLLVPLLMAIAAALWMTVDSSKVHNAIGEKCWTWHRGEKPLEPACKPLLIA